MEKYELAVCWEHCTWDSGFFCNAESEKEAHSKLEKYLAEEMSWASYIHIFTYGIQDIEEE